jgi:hypothetical protein
MDEQGGRTAAVDLYWIPLGAGAHVVRVSGRIYEGLKGFLEDRFPTFEGTSVGSSPKGRSGPAGWVVSGCSATRSVCGGEGPSRI